MERGTKDTPTKEDTTMKDGFLVVRKEKHLDPKFWVCECVTDAYRIFEDVSKYWQSQYPSCVIDTTTYGDNLRQISSEEGEFNVYIIKQKIRQKDECIP